MVRCGIVVTSCRRGFVTVAKDLHPRTEDETVSDLKTEMEQRDKAVAHNEADRQATSAIRLSSWAIIAAVLACAVVAMFVLMVVRL